MGVLGVVTPVAAAHRIGQLRRAGGLRHGALGEIVQRALHILAQVQAPRVERQVIGPGGRTFLEVDRVVEREMAVGALDLARGVDVPGAAQLGLAGQVDARVRDALPRKDLTGGQAGIEPTRGCGP